MGLYFVENLDLFEYGSWCCGGSYVDFDWLVCGPIIGGELVGCLYVVVVHVGVLVVVFLFYGDSLVLL